MGRPRGVAITLHVRRLASALIMAMAPAASIAARTPYAPLDLYDIASFVSPSVAPDGGHVAWTRSKFDVWSDRARTELWLAAVTSKGVTPHLLVGSTDKPGGAVWSPDGRRLAVVLADGPRVQLRAYDVVAGTSHVLLTLPSRPGSMAWSPDGTRIAFTRFVEAPRPKIAGMPAKPDGATWAPPPRIVTDFHYREDGDHSGPEAGYLPPGQRKLQVATLADGAIRTVPLPEGREPDAISRIGWTADSRALVVSSAARFEPDLLDNDLWVVPIDGAAWRKLTAGGGANIDPAVSPDGCNVAWLLYPDKPQFYTQPVVMTMPLAGGTPRVAWPGLDRHSDGASWSADSTRIRFVYNERGGLRLAEVPAAGGEGRVIDADVGTDAFTTAALAAASYSAGGDVIAYPSHTPDGPSALAIRRGGRVVARLDPNPRLSTAKDAGRLEEVSVRSSFDGAAVQGWVHYPVSFDPAKRYPMILYIHGGPNQDFGPYFSFQRALYASAGYITLFINPRGSRGYGEAFANAIDKQFPDGSDYADLMSAVDSMVARPYVDKDNLFVTGESGGGALTAWVIGKTDRFRAAAPAVAALDWVAQAMTSDGGAYIARYWIGAEPWRDPMAYWKRSPLSLVGDVLTPTLVIAGETDYRTPINQAETYFGALKLKGVDAAMLRLPEAGHGRGRPSQKIAAVLATIEWFDTHKAPQPVAK